MEEIISLNYCVYILFSELDHQLYVGYTKDINRRLSEHNEGRNISTQHRRPVKLIFLEYYLFKEDAQARELYFKSSKGKRMMKLMLNNTLKKLGYRSEKPLE
jgi:putative endonuclease